MANVRISDLTVASAVDGTELLEIEQSGISKQVIASEILALGGGGGGGGTGNDSNGNYTANNILLGYTTTATAGGTTTLTVASDYQQYFTGTTVQVCLLPVASTLTLGHRFFIANSSTGSVTVQSSDFSEVVVLAENEAAEVTCILASGTTASSWSVVTSTGGGGGGGGGTVDTTGIPVANQLAIWNDVNTLRGDSGVTTDASDNLFVNNVNARYTSTATAGTTTTLTVASAGQQYFTGSTTQTVLLPVTSTLTLGHQFYIYNASSGDVTVQSSGAADITTLVQDTAVLVTCILTSGTGATSWNAVTTPSLTSVDIATQVTGLGGGVATALGLNANGVGGFASTTGGATFTNKIINTSQNTLLTHTASYAANHTLTSAESYNAVIYVTAAATITLLPIVAGMSVTIVTIGAIAVSVDPDASEVLVLDGTALTGGHKATNLSTAGDVICLTYYGAGQWYAASNGWTDGG